MFTTRSPCRQVSLIRPSGQSHLDKYKIISSKMWSFFSEGVTSCSPVGLLTDQFAKLTDPRTGHAKRHKLIDVIVIAICAVICGADSWVDVEMFGKAKKDWFSRLLELPNGIVARHFWEGLCQVGPRSVRGVFRGMGPCGQRRNRRSGRGHRRKDASALARQSRGQVQSTW